MIKVVRGFVTTPLLPLAILGLVLLPPGPERARVWLFFGILLLASAVGLVRLHATGGYCTARHAMIPGMLLILAAAHGLTRLMARASIPGAWLGLGQERLTPGPPSGPSSSRGWWCSSPAGREPLVPRPVPGLPRRRRLAGREYAGRRPGAGHDRLVALLQRPARLPVRPRLRGPRRSATAAGSCSASPTWKATGTTAPSSATWSASAIRSP